MTEVILLEITYKNKKLQKVCTDPKVSDKKYGSEMSEKIKGLYQFLCKTVLA